MALRVEGLATERPALMRRRSRPRRHRRPRGRAWPLERPVPPRLLWSNTVDHGARMALTGLNLKEISEPGTRSWTELPFGQARGLVGAG
jgi:hypothetical protein